MGRGGPSTSVVDSVFDFVPYLHVLDCDCSVLLFVET